METQVTRKIIRIDEDRCNGCGLCVNACHEGALQLVDGKAKLVRDDYCDGLGDCIGECPQDAIRFEVRPALPYDEAAVAERSGQQGTPAACPSVAAMLADVDGRAKPAPCGCPSSQARARAPEQTSDAPAAGQASALANWPTQLSLIPVNAPYLQGADLLISADCVPFAYGAFHQDLLPGKVVIQACPKLDDVQAHTAKLAAIFAANDLRSVTVARMEVPCCGGLTHAVTQAMAASGASTPVTVLTVAIDGKSKKIEEG